MNNLNEVVEQIQNLEHTRTTMCSKCLTENTVHSLEFYVECSYCQSKTKIRATSANTEIEDVIAESLVWLIRNDKFDEIIEKYKRTLLEEEDE